MAVLSPMTDLEAVNRMLASIGLAPVNTLENSGIGDVAKAHQQLLETTRDVQSVGYSWNTDTQYKLTPDGDGAIILPEGVLDIDASDKSVNVVTRRHPDKGKLALYNQDDQTFEFEAELEVDIIWGYPFNDVPSAARAYIATAAARRFQAQVVSSPVLDRFNEEDEARAYMLLARHERRVSDLNSFRRSPALRRWVGRRAL